MNSTRTAERFYTADEIKHDALNNSTTHWFSPGAMRFFNSRISGNAYQMKSDPYVHLFVSSEKFDYNTPRLYSVRSYNSLTGNVDTIGEFQEYKTSAAAHRAAKKLAEE